MKLFPIRPYSALSRRLVVAVNEKTKERTLARMVLVINETLTPEEIVEVQRNVLSAHQRENLEDLTRFIYEIAVQVREFHEETFRAEEGPARWVALILDLMLDDGRVWSNKVVRKNFTQKFSVADLRDAVFEDIEKSDQEHEADRWWNPDERADVIRWLESSPYRQWVVINGALKRAKDSLEENFFSIASGESSNLTEWIEDAFSDAAREYLKEGK
jgi:hypothetical protein